MIEPHISIVYEKCDKGNECIKVSQNKFDMLILCRYSGSLFLEKRKIRKMLNDTFGNGYYFTP